MSGRARVASESVAILCAEASVQSFCVCDVKNQIKIVLGLCKKTPECCQASKQYMSLKYLHGSILESGWTGGHLCYWLLH